MSDNGNTEGTSAGQAKAWKQLSQIALACSNQPSVDIMADAPSPRALHLAGLSLDLHKQRINKTAGNALLVLADQCQLRNKINRLLQGERVNTTEQRAALHTALRASPEDTAVPSDIANEVAASRAHQQRFVNAVRSGSWQGYTGRPIQNVVHIGIGGSHLGPELVVEALASPTQAGNSPNIRFVANVDPNNINAALSGLDPTTTLFVIVSKSFTTIETKLNGNAARSWFLERTADANAIARHFVAVTTNVQAASEFGIAEANIFNLWPWVGGRYSLWSAVGLPIALSQGWDAFEELLGGANTMDKHFATAPFAENIPVQMALAGIWNTNFLGATNHAVLAYDERLRLLPDYLQQLDMESNGKSVRHDGSPTSHHTAPILWGGRGSNGQHAYHQLLHQGTRAYAADFVLVKRPEPLADTAAPTQHQWLLANALAQSQAMLQGARHADPHQIVRGNRPSSTLVLDELSPFNLGLLLAAYEHKVFCQGALWDINSFDQFGVELGKALASPIYQQLRGEPATGQDLGTQALIHQLRPEQS